LINTVEIHEPFAETDTFDLPRQLPRRSPYHVKDHGAVVLSLRDYNGDGIKAEFALFDAASCADLLTALLGYSSNRDALIWYPVKSRLVDSTEVTEALWAETLFAAERTHGIWRYRLAWPGTDPPRACEARYDTIREAFDEVCRIDH
jgi:hypothetical protein